MLLSKCIWCDTALASAEITLCTKCGNGQIVNLPTARSGLCLCRSSPGRMLIGVIKGYKDGKPRQVCSACAPPEVMVAIAQVVVNANGSIDYSTLHNLDGVVSLAQGRSPHQDGFRHQQAALENVMGDYFRKLESRPSVFID